MARNIIEALEARIAPAVFYVSAAASGANALKVLDQAGANAEDTPQEIASRGVTDATAAVLLQAGDQLVFDVDSDRTFDSTDRLLAEVTSGRALLFLTDAPTGRKNAFELTEITGAAVGDSADGTEAFAGRIYTDINGHIATSLNPDGSVSTEQNGANASVNILHQRIDGLYVQGQVTGWVRAGDDLSNVQIGAKLFNKKTSDLSVAGISAGVVPLVTADGPAPVKFAPNGTSFAPVYEGPGPGGAGASIHDVTLQGGARFVLAGNGGDRGNAVVGPNGGPGGSISDVVIARSTSGITVAAGDGGDANQVAQDSGLGGPGGSISGLTFNLAPAKRDIVIIKAGSAGFASALFFTAPTHDVNGGSISDVDVTVSKPIRSFEMLGGHVPGGLQHGDGGNISNARVSLDSATGAVVGMGEFGGVRIAGGASSVYTTTGNTGGDVTGLSLSVFGKLRSAPVFIVAGTNQNGGTVSADQTRYGGSVSEVQLALHGEVAGVKISSGSGGFHGGPAGDVSNVLIENFASRGPIEILGGLGVSSAGGDVTGVRFFNAAPGGGGLIVRGGDGAQGGDVRDLSFTNSGRNFGGLSILGGRAGFERHDSTTDGTGGAITGFAFTNSGTMKNVAISAGDGYDGGGEVRGIYARDTGGVKNGFVAVAGNSFTMGTFAGADAGDISAVDFYGPKTRLGLSGALAPAAKAEAEGATAGAGTSVSQVRGTAAELRIFASDGGRSERGAGGVGGSVFDVIFTPTSGKVQVLSAGNGGAGRTGGLGGSVYDINVDGDIGNMKGRFKSLTSERDATIGGIGAGIGGQNINTLTFAASGSVSDITADRISAIIAGIRDAAFVDPFITSRNAVETISNINAQAIGADSGARGPHREKTADGRFFDFAGGQDNVFALGEDAPIDGLVIVKSGGILTPLPVAPLKLVQV